MGKKKAHLSPFSTFVQHIQPSTNQYSIIDNEYFPSFHNLDELEQFHRKLIDKQPTITDENPSTNLDIDMKTFAQQYLVDLPDNLQVSPKAPENNNSKRKSNTPVKLTNEIGTKRQRRHVRDLPQSSEFIYTTDQRRSLNSSANIFDSIQNPNDENESVIIKSEPTESDHPTVTPTGFGTSEFFSGLDNYVQNIHLLQPSTSESQPSSSSRPQRIRKQNKFFIEESESDSRPKRLKSLFRRKRSTAPPLTDAEIEQQFGERLPSVKTEQDPSFEPIHRQPQTPIERARAKLLNALGRGHEPDSYLLKIRSREQKLVEVQLAIYSTADWYNERTKILLKIEEALRGLRVSWTKIDIRVDDFDIQISTSSLSNTNPSCFLQMLSESGPLIVHIHDRKHPQQRLLIKCPCPECSPQSSSSLSLNSSLPIIVNASPKRHLNPPSILHKPNISSLHNIQTIFFNELILEHGRNVVISVTQCVLDLALIVSVHSSLTDLCQASNDDYRKIYHETIDPLKSTPSQWQQRSFQSKSTDVLSFYQLIKTNNVNIRNSKAMRNLITSSEVQQKIPCNSIIELKAPETSSSSLSTTARVIRLSITQTALPSSIPLVPKQINIIKPLLSTSTSIAPAIKLSNPVLITNKSQIQPPMK